MRSRTKIKYIDTLRAFATINVVMGHVLCVCLGMWGHKEPILSGMAYHLFRWIYSFHMPLFACITGYLFYYQFGVCEKKISFLKFLSDKIKRLLIPLIVFKYLILQPVWFLTGIRKYGSLADYFINVEAGYLWFLYIIFAVYITLHIARFLRGKLLLPIMILLLLMNSFVTVLPSQVDKYIELLLFAVYGMFLCKVMLEAKIQIKSLPVLICTYLVVYTISFNVYGNVSRLVLNVSVMLLIVLFLQIARYIDQKQVNMQLVSLVSSMSMGIYLFHEPILEIAAAYESCLPTMNVWVELLLLTILSTILSVGATVLLRKYKISWTIGDK